MQSERTVPVFDSVDGIGENTTGNPRQGACAYTGRASVEALTIISRERMGVRAREWHQTKALAIFNADVPIMPHVCLAVLV